MLQDFETFILVLLAIFGGISVVSNGLKSLAPLLHPFKDLDNRVTKIEGRVDKHDIFLDNDKKEIIEIKEIAKENTRVNLALLNHFIDGNGIDKMKELREDIQTKLFEGK